MSSDTFARMLAELRRPSTLPPGAPHGAYDRMVIGLGHAMVGAALVVAVWPLSGWGLMIARLGLALIYWMAKERGDLKRGGTVADGVEDTALVWLGAWYGPAWWPFAVLAAGLWLFWRGARRAV